MSVSVARTPLAAPRRLAAAPRRAGWAFVLVTAAAAACSDETTAVIDVGPTGAPSLTIIRPTTGSCVPVDDDADATVPLQIAVDQIYLRPPGACGAFRQCGHVVLKANGVENNAGSSTVIDVLLRKLADPLADIEISVEVIKDDGEPFLDHADESKPVKASVAITTASECEAIGAGGAGGEGGTAGAGGAAGAGGDAGAGGGTGGAGGAGGTGGVGAGAGGTGGTGTGAGGTGGTGTGAGGTGGAGAGGSAGTTGGGGSAGAGGAGGAAGSTGGAGGAAGAGGN